MSEDAPQESAQKQRDAFLEIFCKDYAPKIGVFFNNWGAIEFSLVKGLAILLKTDETRAKMIFAEISALGPKLKLMRRLLKTQFENNPEKERFLALIGDTQTLSGTRNLYAHASWGYEVIDAKHLAIRVIPGTAPDDTEESLYFPRAISAGDLQADFQKASALQNRWNEFFRNDAPKLIGQPQSQIMR